MCGVKINVDKGGFKYNEKVGLSFRLNSDETLSEAIYVQGVTKCKALGGDARKTEAMAGGKETFP